MLIWLVHDTMERNAYTQMPLINNHADVFSEFRRLQFLLNLHIHLYFVYESSEGSRKPAYISWAFVAYWRDKYKLSSTGPYINKYELGNKDLNAPANHTYAQLSIC